MSKELEALEIIGKLYLINDEQVKDWDKRNFDIIERALQHLEAIDNANPSEALECLEDIYRNGVFISEVSFTKQHPTIRSPETNKTIGEQCDTIKQALIKAQEPKKYLKWEDLEFKGEEQTMKVILNGSVHFLSYYRNMFGDNLCMIDNTGITIWKENKQFFNDLHLERVEE